MQRFRPAVFQLQYAASSASYARAARTNAVTESKPKKKATEQSLSLNELVKAVADEFSYEVEDVKTVADGLIKGIKESVAEGKPVKVQGFGTFKRVETAARMGRNPSTGQALAIGASARPAFTSAKNFKDQVKETWKSEN